MASLAVSKIVLYFSSDSFNSATFCSSFLLAASNFVLDTRRLWFDIFPPHPEQTKESSLMKSFNDTIYNDDNKNFLGGQEDDLNHVK
ncbi:hypothetical protein ES703_47424 [subsurface metagenome]